MRPVRIGLIAAMAALIMTPGAAFAQKGKNADPNAITDAQRKKGMADAPAIVQKAGITCQVSDARHIGAVPANKATNTPERNFYEVACGSSLGFVLGASKDGPVDVNGCVETYGGSVQCRLPANVNVMQPLTEAMAKAGTPCTVTNVRGIGQTSSGAFIEVACQGGAGFIVQGEKPFDVTKAVKPSNCLAYDVGSGQLKCTLADAASRLQIVDKYVADAKVACTIKDRRYIGTFKDGAEGFEASCTDGKGYVLKVDNKGAITPTECSKAPGLCELIDARQAMNEQAALYTRLAKAAGSNCEVASYALFPSEPRKEVLELTCKDGSTNVGVFPVGAKGEVLDCGRAMVAGYKCNPAKAKYDALTADLKALGKTECVVSDVALRAKSDKGQPQIEVACADGKPGYLMVYDNPTKPVDALGCRLTGCTLASNRAPGSASRQ